MHPQIKNRIETNKKKRENVINFIRILMVNPGTNNIMHRNVKKRWMHKWWYSALFGLLGGFTTMIGNAAGPVDTNYLIIAFIFSLPHATRLSSVGMRDMPTSVRLYSTLGGTTG